MVKFKNIRTGNVLRVKDEKTAELMDKSDAYVRMEAEVKEAPKKAKAK